MGLCMMSSLLQQSAPQRCPSPNHGARRGGVQPDMVVLHFTAMQSTKAALARLCDPGAQVSSHYLLAEDGTLLQLVPEARRAWHAGVGQWGDVTDVNSRSIGIEIANRGTHPFAHAQMQALTGLLTEIVARHSIAPRNVIGHSDLAPGRKDDPGRRFDWRRLALMGLSVWPETPADDGGVCQPTDPCAFRAAARCVGYPDVSDADLLEAFRQRFRPWAVGPLHIADLAAAQDLATRYPFLPSPSKPEPSRPDQA